MTLDEKIIQRIQELPESKKVELLLFVEQLKNKTDRKDWSDFSLSSAIRGMGSEVSPYSLEDLRESFK